MTSQARARGGMVSRLPRHHRAAEQAEALVKAQDQVPLDLATRLNSTLMMARLLDCHLVSSDTRPPFLTASSRPQCQRSTRGQRIPTGC
jgi:hypothetical protein